MSSSPFNECTHAYLAATKALLMHLRDVADDRAVAQDLAAKINIAMMRDRSSLQLCRNSFDPFNTAQVIYPDWSTMHVANLVDAGTPGIGSGRGRIPCNHGIQTT